MPQATECEDVFPESAVMADATLVTMASSSSKCWTDARYSNSNFLVEKGKLKPGDWTALRVWPPENVATQFVASATKLYVRTALDAKIWSYEFNQFELLETVSAAESFRKTDIRLDNLKKALVLLIRPASEEVTVWPRVSSTVQAASLGGVSKRWSLSCHRCRVLFSSLFISF